MGSGLSINIAVFTGSRAEYGLLKNLIFRLQSDEKYNLSLIVSGSHLSSSFGTTISELHSDGVKVDFTVPLSLDNIPSPSIGYLCSEALSGVSEVIESNNFDLFLVIGDRYETFAAATAAHLNGIPIIHLHGGETTEGALDDKLRHAITQLSTYHFVSAELHYDRVIAMGHSTTNVFNVGPMVIDELISYNPISKIRFSKSYWIFLR